MGDMSTPFHIQFIDIAANPYIIALYRSFAPLMPGSCWWILDNKQKRHPFPVGKSSVYCEIAESDPSLQNQVVEKCIHSIRNLKSQNTIHILECCEGYLQGLVEFRYRDEWIGSIGICKIHPENRPFLKQVLEIFDGYLTLLATTLEDHDDLELVHHLFSHTISVIHLQPLLDRIMDELCNTLGLTHALMLLINEDGEFYPAQVREFPKEFMKLRNLNLTRYEYEGLNRQYLSSYFELPEEDPIRRWFIDALQKLNSYPASSNFTCMAIPFLRNNYMIGILLTIVDKAQDLSTTKSRLLQLLSVGGASAIDNALILQRMNQRRKALSTIHVVHRLISSKISTKDMIAKIGQLTCQLLKVKKCSIMIWNSEREKLIPRVSLGLENDEVGQQPLALGEGLPGWVAENLNPMVYHSDDHSKPLWENVGERYPSDSYLSVALYDDDIEGVITVSDMERDFPPGDREILLTFAEQAVLAIKNARLHEGERRITINVLKSMANLIETHEPSVPGITVKTCDLAQKMARKLRLKDIDYLNLTYSALLHDTGMLRMLQSKITVQEQQLKGRELSIQFVQALGLPQQVEDIVYHVHEMWNGRGYPKGVQGDDIPLGSRIIAVANSFTILEDRYSQAESVEDAQNKALKVIDRLNKKSFDPEVVQVLRQVIQEEYGEKKD